MISDFEAFCALALMAPFTFHLVLRTRRYIAVMRERQARSQGYSRDCEEYFAKTYHLTGYVIDNKLDDQVLKEYLKKESDAIDKKWNIHS